MFCQSCGTQNPDNALNCSKCNAPLNASQGNIPPQNVQMPPQYPQQNMPYPQPPPKKPFYKRAWFIVIAVIFVLGVIGSALGDDTNPTATDENSSISSNSGSAKTENSKPEISEPQSIEEKEEIIAVSAIDLINAYQENGVKADNMYKGKMLSVTGTIDSIDKDIFDKVYVTLGDGTQYQIYFTQCYFKNDEEISKVAELRPGTEITIVGKCDGNAVLNVMLKDYYIAN